MAAAVVKTISDPVALLLDVDDLHIDTALDVDVGKIAVVVEMADSVGYLYKGIVADMTQEALGVDRSNHSQRLGPMLHNCVRTAFVVAVAAFVVAGWS